MKVTEGTSDDKGVDRAGQQPSSAEMPRWAWIILIVLCAFIVGGGASLLAHANRASVPGSILTGGGAFAGTVALLLALVIFARGERR